MFCRDVDIATCTVHSVWFRSKTVRLFVLYIQGPSGRPPVPIRLMRGDAVEEFAVADPPYTHQPLIQSIVDEINGTGRCPSNGETAARTARVIEDCLAEFNARRR